MKLISSILTKNPCYIANRKITVKGLMLHSVGCSQPSASVFVKNWNKITYTRACVHAFIDANNGDIYQCLPWNHRGWHGGGTSNNTHIGVEMCEPDCIKYTGGSTFTCSDLNRAKAMVKNTYDAAVELFAFLCKEYNLDPLTNIVSHKEGHTLGIASNHGDPEHLWNQLKTGYTMNGFRNDVKKAMSVTETTTTIDDTEKFIWDFLLKQGLTKSGVAGLMGNIQCESGFNSRNLQNSYEKPDKLNMSDDEYVNAVDNGTYDNFVNDHAGFGLCQWTYWSRKQNLLNYRNEKKTSIADLQMQLEFLMKELSTSYKAVLNILIKTNSVREASDAVLLGFEKPANQSEENQIRRASYGSKLYDKYATIPDSKFPYKVKVNTDVLNVRKGPGTNYAKTTVVNRNQVYTIVEESTDGKWGKLKSGAGWICLSYTIVI